MHDSTEPFLRLKHVGPGTFVVAAGADNSAKREILPELLAWHESSPI
jgi:ornithine cyclodeaminase/alanine dehydrogenase-like protein (mu-crystallin family)